MGLIGTLSYRPDDTKLDAIYFIAESSNDNEIPIDTPILVVPGKNTVRPDLLNQKVHLGEWNFIRSNNSISQGYLELVSSPVLLEKKSVEQQHQPNTTLVLRLPKVESKSRYHLRGTISAKSPLSRQRSRRWSYFVMEVETRTANNDFDSVNVLGSDSYGVKWFWCLQPGQEISISSLKKIYLQDANAFLLQITSKSVLEIIENDEIITTERTEEENLKSLITYDGKIIQQHVSFDAFELEHRVYFWTSHFPDPINFTGLRPGTVVRLHNVQVYKRENPNGIYTSTVDLIACTRTSIEILQHGDDDDTISSNSKNHQSWKLNRLTVPQVIWLHSLVKQFKRKFGSIEEFLAKQRSNVVDKKHFIKCIAKNYKLVWDNKSRPNLAHEFINHQDDAYNCNSWKFWTPTVVNVIQRCVAKLSETLEKLDKNGSLVLNQSTLCAEGGNSLTLVGNLRGNASVGSLCLVDKTASMPLLLLSEDSSNTVIESDKLVSIKTFEIVLQWFLLSSTSNGTTAKEEFEEFDSGLITCRIQNQSYGLYFYAKALGSNVQVLDLSAAPESEDVMTPTPTILQVLVLELHRQKNQNTGVRIKCLDVSNFETTPSLQYLDLVIVLSRPSLRTCIQVGQFYEITGADLKSSVSHTVPLEAVSALAAYRSQLYSKMAPLLQSCSPTFKAAQAHLLGSNSSTANAKNLQQSTTMATYKSYEVTDSRIYQLEFKCKEETDGKVHTFPTNSGVTTYCAVKQRDVSGAEMVLLQNIRGPSNPILKTVSSLYYFKNTREASRARLVDLVALVTDINIAEDLQCYVKNNSTSITRPSKKQRIEKEKKRLVVTLHLRDQVQDDTLKLSLYLPKVQLPPGLTRNTNVCIKRLKLFNCAKTGKPRVYYVNCSRVEILGSSSMSGVASNRQTKTIASFYKNPGMVDLRVCCFKNVSVVHLHYVVFKLVCAQCYEPMVAIGSSTMECELQCRKGFEIQGHGKAIIDDGSSQADLFIQDVQSLYQLLKLSTPWIKHIESQVTRHGGEYSYYASHSVFVTENDDDAVVPAGQVELQRLIQENQVFRSLDIVCRQFKKGREESSSVSVIKLDKAVSISTETLPILNFEVVSLQDIHSKSRLRQMLLENSSI